MPRHLAFSVVTTALLSFNLTGCQQSTKSESGSNSPTIRIDGVDRDIPVNVDKLDLRYTNVTKEGLKGLANLKNLTSLDLSNLSGVNDAGVLELAGLKHLTSLNLSRTRVTDAGLKGLSNISNLASLNL